MTEPDTPDRLRTKTYGQRTAYANRWINVDLVDIETPDGHRFEHHVVRLDHVAIAILRDDQQRVLMLWRHRFAVDQWGYEFLGGIVEDGESPARAAAREAEEESGYRPMGTPVRVASFQPMPGMVYSPVDIYMWERFEQVGEPSDLEESGELRWVAVTELPRLVDAGLLLGAPTIIGALRLRSQ